jgi:hypothetical protein
MEASSTGRGTDSTEMKKDEVAPQGAVQPARTGKQLLRTVSRRSYTIVEALFQHICVNDLLSFPFLSLCRGVSRSWKDAVVDGLKLLKTISFHVPWKVRKGAHDPSTDVEAVSEPDDGSESSQHDPNHTRLVVSTGMFECAFAAR